MDVQTGFATAPALASKASPQRLAPSNREDPSRYRPSPALDAAVEVARKLGKPLLLTGPAGTGKTQLAFHLNWRWRSEYPGKVLVYETKSTSTGKDLFYTYDTLARFQAAQTKMGSQEPRDYLHYNALGEAILRSRPPGEVHEILPPDFSPSHENCRRSIVLIDEIDKAPSDFPNDILNEVEYGYFRIPELRRSIVGVDPEYAPFLVLTSYSEKTLPAPFLRRCVFFNIDFPSPEELREIVAARIEQLPIDAGEFPLLKDALELFSQLRSLELEKKPATAELLDWLRILLQEPTLSGGKTTLRSAPDAVLASLSTLAKSGSDQVQVKAQVEQWLKSKAA